MSADLSTPLFDDVPADMNAEEKALFEAAPPTVAFPQPLPQPDDSGREIIRKLVEGNKVEIDDRSALSARLRARRQLHRVEFVQMWPAATRIQAQQRRRQDALQLEDNDHDDEPADCVHVDFWHPELADDECAALALFDECRSRWKAARARLRGERAALLRPYCAGLPMAPESGSRHGSRP